MAGQRARRSIDLHGMTLLPGFVDSHNHMCWAGLAAGSVDLTGCRSVAQILQRIAAAVDGTASEGWIEADGNDQRVLDRPLHTTDLDYVAAGRKVYVGTSPATPAW